MPEPTRWDYSLPQTGEWGGPHDPARRLWGLWRQGQEPRVEEFVASAGLCEPEHILAVLRVDQSERFRTGAWVRAEKYLEAFPTLRDDPEGAVDLIFTEFLLREEKGEQPAVEEYVGRFPGHAEELKLQIELHRAMEAHDGPAASAAGRTVPIFDPRALESTIGPDGLPEVPGFEVLEVIGRGGMGVVYRAWQKELNRPVALKMVQAGAQASRAMRARFRVEAEAVARLQHPNIVQIHGADQHKGVLILVLELVEGRNLAQRIAGTPQPAHWAAELVETLSRAIHGAHRQGVVHRDLTPANILLTGADTPKITDFGLAKLMIGGGDLRSQTGELLGTPSYMAPEQAASRHEAIGAATDVYALGAILYELLTGRPPFKAESPLETLRQVLFDDPILPSRLRPRLARDLETICLKCLHKEPAQRYASALALADDLRRFLDGRPTQARPSGPIERAWRFCRRNRAMVSLLGSVLALCGALAIGSTAAALWLKGSRDQALLERNRALVNFHTAQQAVDESFAKVRENALLRGPGLQSLRTQLLEDALKYYLGLAEAHRALGQPAEAANVLWEHRHLWDDDPAGQYRLACSLAQSIPLAGKGDTRQSAIGHAERSSCGDRAMEVLRNAVAAGFRDADRIQADPHLAPLRARADFQALVAGLASPGGPATPGRRRPRF